MRTTNRLALPRRPRTPLASLSFVAALLATACSSTAPSGPPGSGAAPTSGAAATTQPAGGIPALVDVPFYRSDAARSAIQPGPGPAAKPAVAWQHAFPPSHFLPILANGLVIAGAGDGTVLAVDARSGVERWHFQAAGPVGASAGAANGLVFVGDTQSVFALDAATGTQKWVAAVPSDESRPIVVDGIVYSGAISGVVGLDAGSGNVVWQWHGPDGIAATVGPVVDGVAYISASDGRLYAIDVKTSQERWHVQSIAKTLGYAEVVGDTVYVGTTQQDAPQLVGELYAIDRASGAVRWRFRTPSGGQINAGPVRDGIMYANAEVDGMYALRDDGTTSTTVWRVDAPRSYWPTSLVGDTVYQQRADGSIGAYAIADGKLLWATDAPGDESGGPLVSGGMVFQVQDNHGFAAYATPDLIAQLPSPVPQASATPAPVVGSGPFKQVGAFSWASTGLATVLGMDVGPDGLLYILDNKPHVTVIDPNTGHVVRTWGRQGAGPGEFDVSRTDDNPGNGDIAVAPNGNVYVADGTNHRVQEFKANGTFIRQFGSFGTGPGQFADGSEIEVAPDGSVYVMDDLDNPLSKFTADGKFVWRSPVSKADPAIGGFAHGIAVRGDGMLLLDCEGCHKILVVDPKTGLLKDQLVNDRMEGGVLNLDPKGNMYLSLFYPVSQLVFDPKGTFLDAFTLAPGAPQTVLGSTTTWGDMFWPAPVFLPDGRAFSFGRDGLIQLQVTLP
ncbi:MAG: hypothetical protein QOI92_2376 [Chloroflexota bacterium]|jgi:outer membrane protein assembly factor BamB|nr:hypothetical protein [Chloroflexota bacterium]